MNENPMFSVIVPTFNRSKLLRRAIQSVFQQTYDNWELIIIDNYSEDNSLEAGESITLGLNFTKEKINKVNEIEEFIDFKLASVFRLDEEKNIPINSTLNKKNSNIFGQINFKPIKNISLGYDFSLSNDLNTLEYNSLNSEIEYGNFNTQFQYFEERGIIGKSHTIENTT